MFPFRSNNGQRKLLLIPYICNLEQVYRYCSVQFVLIINIRSLNRFIDDIYTDFGFAEYWLERVTKSYSDN